ncbi:hypothetical protein B0T10DRAFT_456323 [Thelonectria olida]|uniref:Uncharacterized protein n=1 Tax=Thelonectria olida TaxID=1576542 RepID=A0A9P8WDC6_9HYPO|nr:hypothetical protein B0T10DRAFT_456323 [Thelonectria olida]
MSNKGKAPMDLPPDAPAAEVGRDLPSRPHTAPISFGDFGPRRRSTNSVFNGRFRRRNRTLAREPNGVLSKGKQRATESEDDVPPASDGSHSAAQDLNGDEVEYSTFIHRCFHQRFPGESESGPSSEREETYPFTFQAPPWQPSTPQTGHAERPVVFTSAQQNSRPEVPTLFTPAPAPARFEQRLRLGKTKTVWRSQVMEEGSEILRKFEEHAIPRHTFTAPIKDWLDEHKVKVLPPKIKAALESWGRRYYARLVVWITNAPEDLSEYTYACQDFQSLAGILIEDLGQFEERARSLPSECHKIAVEMEMKFIPIIAFVERQEMRHHNVDTAIRRANELIQRDFNGPALPMDDSCLSFFCTHHKFESLFQQMALILKFSESNGSQPQAQCASNGGSKATSAETVADVQELVNELGQYIPGHEGGPG